MARTMQAAKRSISIEEQKRASAGIAKFLSTPIPLPMDQDNDAIPPFEVVSQNLAKIGSLTIEQFLQSPTEIVDFDVPYHGQENQPETSPSPPLAIPPATPKQLTKAEGSSKMQCVAQLHHTCQRVFGKIDLLKFEFIEVDGPNTKQCILTITRPNGSRRSYTTPAVYSRKNEAKLQTAALAVEMGAIDFITTGDMDFSKTKKGLVLAPLDAHDGITSGEVDYVLPLDPEDPAVKEIEDCCIQWRAGRVKPYWIALNETKFKSRQGCALRIELSPHSLRVYSSDTKYGTVAEAKATCAKIALDQGVLEYIRHGNGQTKPEKPTIASSDTHADSQAADTKAIYTSPSPLTLQSFYETFPQPFPENFGDKTAAEINAPSWLNTTMQSARGGKLSTNYVWTSNGTSWGGNLGLQGCLLRIERPGDSRSYLVDARFLKRADAKAAVCLQAIFQGVGDYIRSVGKAAENKITPTMKRWANDMIFPTLGTECHKIEPGMHPRYDFPREKDAYGCTLTLELKRFPTPEETKTYSVPSDYRSKADAKIAVACLAAEQGAVEFLRFRGGPLPSSYRTFHSTFTSGTTDVPNKRKERDDDGLQERKKSKVESKESERPVPLLETKEEAMARINAERTSRQNRSRDNKKRKTSGWKKPHAPGSGGLGAISKPAQSSLIGQNRSGNRSASNTPKPHKGGGPPSQLQYPPAPSRAGPAHSNRPSFPPAPQERPAQVEPQPDHLMPGPSVPPFSQVGPYSPASFMHAPPSSGYYSSHGSNIPYGQPVLPQQYHGAGPAPAPAPPYPYLNAPFPLPPHYPPPPPSIPPHVYQSQYPPHSYSGGPVGSTPNMVSGYAPGYDNAPYVDTLPGNPGQPSYNLHNQHHSQSPPVVSAQSHSGDGSMKDSATEVSANVKQLHEDPQLRVTAASTPKLHVTSLLDYCSKEGVSLPQFHQKAVTDDAGKVTHKVWVIMGNEKLELPVTFATVNEGRERVAKQVLGRLRSKRKVGK